MANSIGKFELIAQVESAMDFHALRFEPGKYASLTNGPMLKAHADIVYRIQSIHKCSLGTAQMIYCTSFGAVQIMGFNLYGKLDCSRESIDYLNTPDLQRSMFNSFLQSVDLDHYSLDDMLTDVHVRKDFAIKYNGSIAYAYAIERAAKELGLTVV